MERAEIYISQIIEKSRLKETDQFIHHGNTTILEHNVAVARRAYRIAKGLKLNISEKELIFGAMLHDYYFYDWHEKDAGHRLYGYYHPGLSLKNAVKEMELTAIEKDIIKKHMFPLTLSPPKYKESFIVCLADKICALEETFRKKKLVRIPVEVDKQF